MSVAGGFSLGLEMVGVGVGLEMVWAEVGIVTAIVYDSGSERTRPRYQWEQLQVMVATN